MIKLLRTQYLLELFLCRCIRPGCVCVVRRGLSRLELSAEATRLSCCCSVSEAGRSKQTLWPPSLSLACCLNTKISAPRVFLANNATNGTAADCPPGGKALYPRQRPNLQQIVFDQIASLPASIAAAGDGGVKGAAGRGAVLG